MCQVPQWLRSGRFFWLGRPEILVDRAQGRECRPWSSYVWVFIGIMPWSLLTYSDLGEVETDDFCLEPKPRKQQASSSSELLSRLRCQTIPKVLH